jgi:phage terminase small subunit
MGIPSKKPRFSTGRDHKLTDKQRSFVAEYVIDLNATRAAVAAGYSARTAASMGCQLLDRKAYPLVATEVKKALAEKELRAEKKADDVLRYIHTAMWFQPLHWFLPGEDGGWFIDPDKVDSLPPHIGCLIEEMELRKVVVGASENRQEVTRLWVRLVSKTAAMTLAAKHQLGEKIQTTNTNIDVNAILTAISRTTHKTTEERLQELVKPDDGKPVEVKPLPIGLKELSLAERTPAEMTDAELLAKILERPASNGHVSSNGNGCHR